MVGEFYAVLALVLFGLNAFIVIPASARVPQSTGFLIVLLANSGFSLAVVLVQRLASDDISRPDPLAVLLFAVAGVFANYLGRWGYFRTVQSLGPSRASAFQNSSPLFAVVLGWALLRQPLDRYQIAFMAVVICGLYLASSIPRGGGGPVVVTTVSPVREVMVAVSSAGAFALGNVIRGAAVLRWNEPVLGALLGALAAAAAYIMFQVPVRTMSSVLRDLPLTGTLLWLLSGVVTICAQAAMIAATAYLPVGVVVAISAAAPVVVIPVSLVVLANEERISLRTVAGALLITSGVSGLLLV